MAWDASGEEPCKATAHSQDCSPFEGGRGLVVCAASAVFQKNY